MSKICARPRNMMNNNKEMQHEDEYKKAEEPPPKGIGAYQSTQHVFNIRSTFDVKSWRPSLETSLPQYVFRAGAYFANAGGESGRIAKSEREAIEHISIYLSLSLYIYIYILMNMYVYIYIERERERDRGFGVRLRRPWGVKTLFSLRTPVGDDPRYTSLRTDRIFRQCARERQRRKSRVE